MFVAFSGNYNREGKLNPRATLLQGKFVVFDTEGNFVCCCNHSHAKSLSPEKYHIYRIEVSLEPISEAY